MKMLENAKILQNDGILDVEAMERYINEALGGTIGQEYADVQVSLTFTEGEQSSADSTDATDTADVTTGATETTDATEITTEAGTADETDPEGSKVWIVFVAVGGILVAVCAVVVIVVIGKKKKTV
jgi:hypothetical protein